LSQPRILDYYYDAGYTQQIPVDAEGIPIMDFDRLPARQSSELLIYAKNVLLEPVTIANPWTDDEDLSITDYPARLEPGETGSVSFLYQPPLARVRSLKARWGFREVVIG